MITFEQFLQEKMIGKMYGMGSHASKLVSVVNPAKPIKPVYTGMSVQKILPVPRSGKPKAVMGS